MGLELWVVSASAKFSAKAVAGQLGQDCPLPEGSPARLPSYQHQCIQALILLLSCFLSASTQLDIPSQ